MILVAGGTGRLGRALVPRLTGRGLDVRVLSRSPARSTPGTGSVDVTVGDVRSEADVTAAVTGCDVVVSAVHGFVGRGGVSPRTVDRDGNAHLINAARAAGADLVLMSVVGAAPDSAMELFRMKHAAEQLARESGVPTTIVRATAFMELWVDLLRASAVRSGSPMVFGHGDNPINFVSVGDVAALVDHVVTDPTSRGEILEIGGPDNLTFNDLARAVQAADGRNGPPRHIPPMALRFVANTIGRLKPQLGRQARAALAMDSGDHTFDASPIHLRFPDLPTTPIGELLPLHR